MGKISISIIIPVYNVKEYLEECLLSVINQTLKNIEIICIDDGSTDQSVNIINFFQKLDDRIKLIKQENQGAGIARNNGILVSKGEFISFMDPDDYYPDTKVLEDLYNTAIINQTLIAGGNCNMINTFDDKIDTNYELKKNILKRQEMLNEHNFKFENNCIIPFKEYKSAYCYWRFIYNSDFLKKQNITFPNYRRFQDPPFLANVIINNPNVSILKRDSYQYRINHKVTDYDYKKYSDSIDGTEETLNIYNNKSLYHYSEVFFDFLNRIKKMNELELKFTHEQNENIKEKINNIFSQQNFNFLELNILKKIKHKNIHNNINKFLNHENNLKFNNFLKNIINKEENFL